MLSTLRSAHMRGVISVEKAKEEAKAKEKAESTETGNGCDESEGGAK